MHFFGTHRFWVGNQFVVFFKENFNFDKLGFIGKQNNRFATWIYSFEWLTISIFFIYIYLEQWSIILLFRKFKPIKLILILYPIYLFLINELQELHFLRCIPQYFHIRVDFILNLYIHFIIICFVQLFLYFFFHWSYFE